MPLKFSISPKYLGLGLLLGLCQLLPGFSYAQGGSDAGDKIIARVDDYIVLLSELEATYQQYLAETRGRGYSEDLKCRILESIVTNKLLVAKADIDSVMVEEVELQDQLDRRMEYFVRQAGGPDKLENLYQKPLELIKEELREQVREQMVVERMEEHITQGVKVTPKEVQDFFKTLDTIPFINEEGRVGHIVKIPEPNKNSKAATREKLEQLRARIIAGEDFGILAQTYSQDPLSAVEGGNLGWVTRGMFTPEYEAVAFKLQPGELSKVIESPFGFHLIQLIDRRGDEFNSKHILLRPEASKGDIKEAERFLDSLRTLIIRDSLTFEKAAKLHSDDINSSTNGGYISSGRGDGYVPLDMIDKYLYFVVDSMTVGNITKPIPYRTDDGKEAMRIVYLQGKRDGHFASLERDYPKIQQMALAKKKEKTIEQWFTQARDEVFVYIDPEYLPCNILGSNKDAP